MCVYVTLIRKLKPKVKRMMNRYRYFFAVINFHGKMGHPFFAVERERTFYADLIFAFAHGCFNQNFVSQLNSIF